MSAAWVPGAEEGRERYGFYEGGADGGEKFVILGRLLEEGDGAVVEGALPVLGPGHGR